MGEKKLKVFLDSNIFISGLFSEKGAQRLILDILSLGLPPLAAVTGAYNIAEVERNLRAKLPEALPVFQSIFSALKMDIIPVPSAQDLRPWAGVTADKDLPVLVSAIQAKADVLVTGDKKDLLKLKTADLPLRIASPSEFLDEILPRFLKEHLL
jgi:putative PIN family toxin of toxin-antitoxin system